MGGAECRWGETACDKAPPTLGGTDAGGCEGAACPRGSAAGGVAGGWGGNGGKGCGEAAAADCQPLPLPRPSPLPFLLPLSSLFPLPLLCLCLSLCPCFLLCCLSDAGSGRLAAAAGSHLTPDVRPTTTVLMKCRVGRPRSPRWVHQWHSGACAPWRALVSLAVAGRRAGPRPACWPTRVGWTSARCCRRRPPGSRRGCCSGSHRTCA